MKNQHQNYDDERADLILDLVLKVISLVVIIGSAAGITNYFLS